MPRYRQSAFNGGVLSPRIMGRIDLEKSPTGLQVCQNAIALPTGGVTKRPGFQFISEAHDPNEYSELVPFEFSEDQSYVLEFGDEVMRVFYDGGIVVSPDADTLLLLHGDGRDESITIKDDSDSDHACLAYGNAQIDEEEYYFPTGSIRFDGAGDYISIADHADFVMGAADYTLDTRIRFYANDGISMIWNQEDATAGDRIAIWVDHAAGTIHHMVIDTGAVVVNQVWTWAPSVDTWYHIALIRGFGAVADAFTMCIDGTPLVPVPNAELVTNGTMEADANWADVNAPATNVRSNTFAHAGAFSRKFTGTLNSGIESDTFTTATDHIYRYNVWVYCPFLQTVTVQIVDGAGTADLLNESFVIAAATWTKITGTVVDPGAGGAGAYFQIVNGTAASRTTYVDDVSFIDVALYPGAVVMPDHSLPVELGGNLGVTAQACLDYTGRHPVMTLAGGALITNGASKFGAGCMYFDGADDYTYVAASDDWRIIAATKSIMDFWVKHTDHVGTEFYVTQYQDANNYWCLAHTHGTGIVFNCVTGGVLRWQITGTEITDTNWHHIAMVNSGDKFGMYLDGVEVGVVYDTGNYSHTGVLYFGVWPAGGSLFQGYIDCFRIQLGQDDPNIQGDAGLPIFDSSASAHGYATSLVSVQAAVDCTNKKWGTASLSYNGSTRYSTWANHADWDILNNTDATVDCWVRLATHAGASHIIGQYQDVNNYWLVYNNHGVGLTFYVWVGGVAVVSITGPEIADSNWHHIAVCKVDHLFGLYVDGVQVAYVHYDTAQNLAGPLYMGGMLAGFYLDGNLDDARITHTNAFSAAPVVGLTDTITVPTAAHSVTDAKFLAHCDAENFAVPTAPHLDNQASDVYILRTDISDLYGWIDELRLSDVARWTETFTPATQEYPAGGGSTTYEEVTPYSHLDVRDLRVIQSTDTLYVFHPLYPPMKIVRNDDDDWDISEIDWRAPPWNDINTTATTLDPDATAIGPVNVVASVPFFTAASVGAYFAQANGYYQIDTVTNSTTAVGTIIDTLDNHNATANWYRGSWDADQGYPSMACFHEDRLVVIGSAGQPLTVFFSETADYENFGVTAAVATDPMQWELWSEKQNALQWLKSSKKLLLGSYGSEFLMYGATEGAPIDATASPTVRRESTYGGRNVMPCLIGDELLFVRKSGRAVWDWVYNTDRESYIAENLNILVEHLTRDTRIVKIEYAQDPDGIAWCCLENGYLLGLTLLREQKVIAWHIHNTEADGVVESIAVIPGDEYDELWAVVCRQIGGVDARYIEKLNRGFFGGTLTSDAIFVDAALSYTGAATTSFTGLSHLAGETVEVLADGYNVGPVVVDGAGAFNLTNPAAVVHAGLGYDMNLQTLGLNIDVESGNTSNKLTRVVEIMPQVYETGEFQYGRDDTHLLDAALPTTLNTDSYLYSFNGEHAFSPSVYLKSSAPVPFTLLSLTSELEIEEVN